MNGADKLVSRWPKIRPIPTTKAPHAGSLGREGAQLGSGRRFGVVVFWLRIVLSLLGVAFVFALLALPLSERYEFFLASSAASSRLDISANSASDMT